MVDLVVLLCFILMFFEFMKLIEEKFLERIGVGLFNFYFRIYINFNYLIINLIVIV